MNKFVIAFVGVLVLVISSVVLGELVGAPAPICELLIIIWLTILFKLWKYK